MLMANATSWDALLCLLGCFWSLEEPLKGVMASSNSLELVSQLSNAQLVFAYSLMSHALMQPSLVPHSSSIVPAIDHIKLTLQGSQARQGSKDLGCVMTLQPFKDLGCFITLRMWESLSPKAY